MNDYQKKDLLKFKDCNKMICYGAIGSSTFKYQTEIYREIVNLWEYSHWDIVGISINGNRPNRIGIDIYKKELSKLSWKDVTIIVDSMYDRMRSYNVWEREVVEYLKSIWFTEVSDWKFCLIYN